MAKALAPRFPEHRLEKHKILRVVKRVNRKCVEVYGRVLIEKRGKRWAFSSFGVEIWGKTRKDLEAEVEVTRSNTEEITENAAGE